MKTPKFYRQRFILGQDPVYLSWRYEFGVFDVALHLGSTRYSMFWQIRELP